MSIEVKGLDEVQKKLQTLQDSLTGPQMQVKLRSVGVMVKNSIAESFENEASPFGKKWKPISSITAFSEFGGGGLANLRTGKQKAYYKNGKKQTKPFLSRFGMGGSKRILVASGALAGRWIVAADDKSVSVSNNSSNNGCAYGLTHQFGTDKAGKHKNIHIPARPFLPIDNSGNLESKLAKSINGYLENEILKVFKD